MGHGVADRQYTPSFTDEETEALRDPVSLMRLSSFIFAKALQLAEHLYLNVCIYILITITFFFFLNFIYLFIF